MPRRLHGNAWRASLAAFIVGACVASVATESKALFRGRAFIDRAIPAVGGVVGDSPRELQLSFTQPVDASLSKIDVSASGGQIEPTGKATQDRARSNVLHVRLGRVLKPGVYVVRWRVVSRNNSSSGDYRFTVSP
jgi:methionine-rich copper-binding protein CopC